MVRVNRAVFYVVICFSHHQWTVNGATGVTGPRVQPPVVVETRQELEAALTQTQLGMVGRNVRVSISKEHITCNVRDCPGNQILSSESDCISFITTKWVLVLK